MNLNHGIMLTNTLFVVLFIASVVSAEPKRPADADYPTIARNMLDKFVSTKRIDMHLYPSSPINFRGMNITYAGTEIIHPITQMKFMEVYGGTPDYEMSPPIPHPDPRFPRGPGTIDHYIKDQYKMSMEANGGNVTISGVLNYTTSTGEKGEFSYKSVSERMQFSIGVQFNNKTREILSVSTTNGWVDHKFGYPVPQPWQNFVTTSDCNKDGGKQEMCNEIHFRLGRYHTYTIFEYYTVKAEVIREFERIKYY